MELLVRVVDKEKSGDPALDAKRTEAGDVIAYQPDGWRWGKEEIANPEWRIIRVPGMSATEAEALIAAEAPRSFQPTRALRKRQMRLDVPLLDELHGLLAERQPTRARSFVDAVIPHADVVAARSLKDRLSDPRLIGGDPGAIGE